MCTDGYQDQIMSERIIDILNSIEGISTADGLLYCGDAKAYEKFIRTFYDSIEKKTADIEDALQSEDIPTYTTRVHALKSTARIAGISEIAEYALKLEEAGENGDLDYIIKHNDEFLRLYRSYKDKLSVLDEMDNNEQTAGDSITEDELKDAYEALREYIEILDYDAVEVILEAVNTKALPEKDRKIMKELDKHLRNMEWDEMGRIISGIR